VRSENWEAAEKKIKVLIVDDSAVARRILSEGLSADPGIEVVGTATDAFVARDKIVRLMPDVLTLDVEMPRMDGLTFLEHLMVHYPLPVIILSSLNQKGGEVALKALDLGAVEVVAKPSTNASSALSDMIINLGDKIKAAAHAKMKKEIGHPGVENLVSSAAMPVLLKANKKEGPHSYFARDKVLALGASTGGIEVLHYVLSRLPETTPGTLIVQHLPAYFTASFAERLNKNSAMEVREAREGDVIKPGLALLAPGDFHMILRKRGTRLYVEVQKGPLVCRQRPSVEVLFKSVARYVRANAVGVIMTGMGSDGAIGLLEMRKAGAVTIGQDERSCAVYGMPKQASELGAVRTLASIEEIPQMITQSFAEKVTV